jgi:hypothetical protein
MARGGWKKQNKVEVEADKPSVYARKQKLDPLTERLGEKGFFHHMRWPWLVVHFGGLDHPLEVSRFYPTQNLAVDIGQVDQTTLEYKTKLFEEHAIKYVVLNSSMDFMSLSGVM